MCLNSNDMWKKVFKRKEDIVSRKIAGEAILVPVRGKLADMQRIFSLNAVGEYVWGQLDGKRSVGAIRDGILARFDVAEEQANADVREFIAELLKADLVVGVD